MKKRLASFFSTTFSKEHSNKCVELGNHIKEEKNYCVTCSNLICEGCIEFHKDHKHKAIDLLYEDIIQESKEFSDDLRAKITELESIKIQDEELFKTSVETHHDTQMNFISNHFKELHDSLHFKEIELKRELKSYHDENLEILATVLSQLESEIDRSNKFIAQFNNNINSDNQEYYKHLIKSRNDFLQNKDQNNQKVDNKNNNNNNKIYNVVPKYSLYSLNSKAKQTIEKLALRRGKKLVPVYRQNENEVKEKFIYFNGKKFSKYTLDGERIQKSERKEGFVRSGCNYFWNNTVVGDKIYVFSPTQYIVYDSNDSKEVERGDCQRVGEGAYVYDGHDHIYMFHPSETPITRFNIKTNRMETHDKFSKFPNLSYPTFDLNLDQNLLYVIGGYNTKDSWQNSIHSINIETQEISLIQPYSDMLIICGCFVPDRGFFLITWSATFMFYDPVSGIKTELTYPPTHSPTYSKLYHVGDYIYLMIQNRTEILIYEPETDMWLEKKIKFDEDITLQSYISIS